jgi:hypothetical protein
MNLIFLRPALFCRWSCLEAGRGMEFGCKMRFRCSICKRRERKHREGKGKRWTAMQAKDALSKFSRKLCAKIVPQSCLTSDQNGQGFMSLLQAVTGCSLLGSGVRSGEEALWRLADSIKHVSWRLSVCTYRPSMKGDLGIVVSTTVPLLRTW